MRKFILAVLIVLSMTMGFDALALAPVTASPWTTTTNPATARAGLVVYSTSEVNALITTATNALATTNYVNSITNGLATTNYAKSVTNNFTALVYTNPSSILYTSSLPALTNGFVTSSITNGLATTNYVNAATNGLVTSSITNGLATTNYVNTSIADKTNFPGIYVTNSAYIGTTFAQGNGVTASGLYSSAFGFLSLASGNYSHVEGSSTIASGTSSHAEGSLTVASAGLSHAEGSVTIASGYASHAEGDSSTASGQVAHAEGYNTTASGEASHAAGAGARATNDNTYVWSDNTAFGSTTTAQYSVYAANGIRLLGGPISGNGGGLTNLTLNGITNVGTAAYSNATAFYLNSNPSNYVTSSVTNGLATTNYVNAATNGFVTSSITNGLATTNYVNAATNGLVTSSITNGLATTNYVNTATNGLVTASVTNGLATTSYVLTQISNTNLTNLIITTNLVVAATNNFTAIVYSNPAAYRSIGNTNFPGIYITNNAYIGGYVSNNSGQFTFAMKGDTYGGSKLILQNRNGQNGPLFDGSDCTIGALIDFGLRTTLGVNYDHVFRLEQRGGAGQLYRNDPDNSGYGEIQFFRKQGNGIFASLGEYSSSIGLNPSPTTTNTFNVSGTTSLSGNTGIGTETPRGKLDVIGGTLYSIGDSPGFDSFNFVGDSSGAYSVIDAYYEYDIYPYKNTPLGRVYSVNPIVFAGTDSSYVPGYGDAFLMQWNLLPTDGADGYRVIVVSDPSYGAAGDYYFDTTSTFSQISTVAIGYEDDSSQYYTAGTPVVTPKTIDTRSQFYFDSSSNNIIAMPYGYFGIGTTNPAYMLDVNGSIGDSSDGNFQIGGPGASGSWLDGNNVQNVGIGTFSPAYKLDVNGSGHFVGAVKFDANITGALTNLAMYSSTNYNGVLTNSTIRNATITNTTYYGNGVGLTNIASTNVITANGTLAVISQATNYTVNLLPGGIANLQQIYLANTNCYITFTGTNIIDSQRAVLFRGWTNTVVSTLTFALPAWRTNYTTVNYFVTNGQSAVFNFYNTDTTGSNVMVSDGGRWK